MKRLHYYVVVKLSLGGSDRDNDSQKKGREWKKRVEVWKVLIKSNVNLNKKWFQISTFDAQFKTNTFFNRPSTTWPFLTSNALHEFVEPIAADGPGAIGIIKRIGNERYISGVDLLKHHSHVQILDHYRFWNSNYYYKFNSGIR